MTALILTTCIFAIIALFIFAVLLFTYRVATWRVFDETGDWL